jgi:hypothetical protein
MYIRATINSKGRASMVSVYLRKQCLHGNFCPSWLESSNIICKKGAQLLISVETAWCGVLTTESVAVAITHSTFITS